MADEDELGDLGRLLRTATFGRSHRHFAAVDSTNDVAAAWAKAGCAAGALVTADTQRAGRGRRGRTWFSPPGESLYASLVLRPGPVATDFGALGLAVGAGLRRGLVEVGIAADLKWPNDLEVSGRKLGGILCEAKWTDGGPEVVVGFGLNVHTLVFAGELRTRAVSLAGLGVRVGRARLLASLLAALEPTLASFVADGFAGIRELYEPYCTLLGRHVTVNDPRIRGPVIARGLDVDGALRVEPAAGGASFRIEAADVWLAPP